MQQKKNTTLTTSTANGRAAHTIPTLMKRITVLLALIVSFALGVRAEQYVFYYEATNGTKYYMANVNNTLTAVTTYNASTCVWEGESGGTFSNNGRYINLDRNYGTVSLANNDYVYDLTINNEGYVYYRRQNGTNYYIYYSNNSFSNSSNNYGSTRVRAYKVEPTPTQYVFYYSSNYGGASYLAVNDERNGVTGTQNFNAETCIWTGVDVGAGLYSATVDGKTYYLILQYSNSQRTYIPSITENQNQATQWTINGAKLYSNGRYVRYSNSSWTTTTTSTNSGTDVLYPITKISEGTPTTTVEYTVGNTTVSPTAAAVDYGKSQQFTANASVTKTTTTTKTDTYEHSSSTGNTIQPKPSVSSTSSETLSPTGYDWSLSSTNNLTIGTGTASTNSVTYSTASGTTKNVTLNVTAYYMDGTSKKQGTAGTATITVNEKKDDPTGITANDLTLAVDEERTISYTLTPSNAHDNIAYSGFDNAIISITDGVVKGLKAGITTVTLTAKNLNGTNSAHSATSTVTVTPKAPTIEFALGANITATISTTETGATIYYTTDGTTPTTSSPVYTAPVSVTAGATVKAIVVVMANDTPLTSPVAEALANAESGIVGNTVYLYDLEDHNWTYYQQSENLPSGYPTTYLSSPNPRNIKITYRGGGINGASAVAISALEREEQNEMVYYKTLEKSVPGMSGDYPYTVISNPFSKRPATGSGNNKTYYGFAGWKVVEGGEYISEHNDTDVLDLDETIHFINLDNNYTPNCMSAEIVFEATWTQATVKTGNSAPSFTDGTYETNFWVLTGNPDNAITVPTNCTMTARYPDGSVSWDGNFTRAITAGGNNAKVEFVNMNSTGNVSAANYTFTMGRGIVNSGNGGELRGCTNSNADCIQTVKVESGKYASLRHFTAGLSNARRCDQLMILGCDYDRAKIDNSKLQITGSMYLANGTTISRASGVLFARSNIKSGTFQKTITGTYSGTAAQSYYFGCYGSNNRSAGHRYMLVEGGDIRGLCGGTDHTTNQQAEDPAFTLRIRGSENNPIINGIIYGAAENADCRGRRTMVLTGGTVKGWIAGGANGTESSGGTMTGATFVYVGGKANINSSGSQTVINRAVGGNVFAAGCGNSTNSSSGQVTLGTNVVVADDAYVERGVYGGGSYGYTTNTSNIYITGGRIGGVAGGVNGTSYSANIPGGVYGGACQNRGGTVNIYMTDGEVNGGLYGGCNNSGTISNNVTMQINGGQVGTSSAPANIHGGGYGQATQVSGNVEVTLGAANQTTNGVTVYGDVYGGSALGTVNSDANDHTYVTMHKGTINGSLYGGGLGSTSVAANVNGPVKVEVHGGSVKATSAAGSGGVYGANNIKGAPQRSVTVDIYRTDPAPAEGEYALYAVYGGGNQADYLYGNGYPTVTVHGCDNSIEYIYGGGNAAAVAATDVTIYGGNVIGNVFGGGNGESGTAADVNGNVDLKICGGTIRNVFGGSNSLGEIKGNVNVNVNSQGEGEKTPCPMIIGNVYGGGNEADGNAGTLTIGCTGALVEGDEGHLAHPENIGKTLEGIGAVYGGANNANIGTSETPSSITLNINSGMVANVFGGNNTGGNIYGDITVNVNKNAETCGWYVGNVYGAGNLAAYTGSPVVNIQNGTVSGNVFGGGLGETAIVTGNPQVTIGDAVAEHTAIVGGDVYGGGDAANVVGTPVVNIVNKCNTTIGNVYGGGNAADVNGTDVNIDGGTITGMVFGGGHGDNSAEPQISANVNGNVNLDITGGTINKVFGGSNSMGNITGSIALNIQKVDGHCDMRIAEVYGGGNEADGNAGSLTIGCTGALVEGDEGHLAHPENIGKTLEGIGAVYGGANNANIGNDVTLNINSGMVAKVFGGNNTGGTVNGNVTVNVNENANACGWYVGKVHGGGYGNGTNVAGNVTVNIENGTIYGDVYGGSALGKVNTNTSNTTTVNLTGGLIKGDAYGGGLGDSDTEADVNGNVTVTLNGTAFELTTTTDDKGNSIPTSGRVFGCNNINGSPKGTVLVKVLKTVAKNSDGTIKDKPTTKGVYELQAVYGGGNLAAYNPTDPAAEGQFTSYSYGGKNVAHDNTDKPVQVVIDGCGETSIEYVYGGGNAAATPATDVTILGSYEIGSVFGGGNGKDRYTLDGGTTWNENEGADVGVIDAAAYATDKSQGKYGTGNAMTSVLGGTVHNIYGGSNMKGNIVGNAVAYLDAASDCPLDAGDIYGGGNEAYMDGGSSIQLGCITYLKEIYGGARNANVGGDINLTITSGHFDRVFGGNNLGGTIKGSITVNIEETGCNPITIGELYGCGNKAPYTTPGDKHPTINIRSFTSIGNVYGGGLGKDAVVEGNPTININVVKGDHSAVEGWSYNGKTIDFGDGSTVTLPVHEMGEIGAIGTVFGGGNAAMVIGNTNVNIGTESSVVFESLTGTEAERTKAVEGADIRGNVYGGGNQADVTGKTNVKVGKGN